MAGLNFNLQYTPILSIKMVIIGYVLYILGQALNYLSKKTNAFFFFNVRVDKNQKVCQKGIYSVIRHPGYLGQIISTIATPFVLGNIYLFFPIVLQIVFLVIRTHMEDQFLQRELIGYSEYVKTTKFRLLPFLY